jgi:hypothetical protein
MCVHELVVFYCIQASTDRKLQRRRAQTRAAQRAFRQRKENELNALTKQIRELRETIEKLNTYFLQLVDILTASKWLEKDRNLACQLRETIKTFLDLSKDIPASKDEHTPRLPTQ